MRSSVGWDDDEVVVGWPGLPQLPGDVSIDACVVGLGASGLAAVAALVDRGLSVIGLDAGRVAALVIEPVLGEGGFVVPGEGFLPTLARFAKDNGIMFVADEVQTGLGRTGRWFAIQHEGVVPDMVTTAKSLGGGLPISAVTASADVMDGIHVGGLGGTFGGNPLACRAALAVLERIERDGLLKRAERIGEVAIERLREMRERHELVGDVRGRGAMVAVELVTDRRTKEPAAAAATRVIKECYREGVIVLKAGTYDNVVRLLPPLTIDEGLLLEGLDVLDKALGASGA